MGCDIHVILERKVGDAWIGIHAFPYWYQRNKTGRDTAWPVATERNYDRFGALAGVRRDEGPAPKGLPIDASPLARQISNDWDSDGHSHSWMSVEEAIPIFVKTEWVRAAPDEWTAKYPGCYFFGIEPGEEKDYRIVFFFDN